MNREELKKILKPLIKECIRESILEEGVLSTIISEVFQAQSGQNTVFEEKAKRNTKKPNNRIHEARKKMANAVGRGAYEGIFEDVQPLKSAGNPAAAPEASNPLSSYAPGDEGISIDGLMSVVGDKWDKLRG